MNLIIYYDKSLIQFDLACELSPNSSWFPGKEKKKEE